MKKISKSSVAIFFSLLVLVVLFKLITLNVAHASNQTSSDGRVTTSFSLDKNTYAPGAVIGTSGSITINNISDTSLLTNVQIINSVNGQSVHYPMSGSFNNTTSASIPTPSSSDQTTPSSYSDFYAPSTPGSYTAKLNVTFTYVSTGYNENFTLNYTVAAPVASTVTVYANGSASNITVGYGTSLPITWLSANATGCSCTYSGGSCGSSGASTGRTEGSTSVKMTATTTFYVNCTP